MLAVRPEEASHCVPCENYLDDTQDTQGSRHIRHRQQDFNLFMAKNGKSQPCANWKSRRLKRPIKMCKTCA